MAEHVGSAVVGEVVGTAASLLTNKYEELTGISDKIPRLKWEVLKIESAIEECNKYDIQNVKLEEMQQELIEVAKEGNEVLQAFENSSYAAYAQRSDQSASVQNPVVTFGPDAQHSDRSAARQDQSFSWLTTLGFAILTFNSVSAVSNNIWHHMRVLLLKMREIQKLNRILERTERTSDDIGVFLEMLRQQKRKRERRRRYRPYLSFFQLLYLELVQDALDFWRVQVSLVQFLVPEIVALVESKRGFELQAGDSLLPR